MKTQLPQYADIALYFQESVVGVELPSVGFVNDLIDSIKDEANDYMGYSLFNTSISTSYYNYPSSTGILFIPYYDSINQITLSTNVLAQNTDYWMINPRNIQFNLGGFYWPNTNAVMISGVIGFNTSIPTQIWRGFIDYASYKVIFANASRTYVSLKQADVEMKMDKPIDYEKKWFDLLDGWRY